MNNAKKMARRLVLLVVSVELLIPIPKERVIRMFHILIERQSITNPEYLSFLWRVDKESLLITAGFALLLIVAVINLLGFFSVLINPTGPDLPTSGSAQTNAGRHKDSLPSGQHKVRLTNTASTGRQNSQGKQERPGRPQSIVSQRRPRNTGSPENTRIRRPRMPSSTRPAKSAIWNSWKTS